VSAYDGAQLQHITEHEKVLKIIPVILQIITTAEMLSTDKDSKQHLAVNAAFSNLINNDIAKNEKVVLNTLLRQNLFPDINLTFLSFPISLRHRDKLLLKKL